MGLAQGTKGTRGTKPEMIANFWNSRGHASELAQGTKGTWGTKPEMIANFWNSRGHVQVLLFNF